MLGLVLPGRYRLGWALSKGRGVVGTHEAFPSLLITNAISRCRRVPDLVCGAAATLPNVPLRIGKT
jgi:hypothetical protein